MSIALADCRLHVCYRSQLNLSVNGLGPEGAKALAPALVRSSLTKLDARYNFSMVDLDEGNAALRKAVEGRAGFELEL